MFRFVAKKIPQRAVAAVATAVGTAAAVATASVAANDDTAHAYPLPWDHGGFFGAFDHKSLRRGHQVYKEVCSTCHSLNLVAFRTLEGVAYTQAEIKEMAAEVDVVDGPNDEGEMFERPGKPSDYFPAPYANDESARSANGGALPPDLSLITKARHDGQNYVFALLTGYTDAPAGTPPLRDGLYYNPYFPGGAIGMPAPLMDEAVEFADGTEATVSQMAKDVVTFLTWAAEPELEERKLLGMRAMVCFGFFALSAGYYKRLRWLPLKTRTTKYK